MGTITCENSVDYAEREAKGMAGCKLLLNRGLVFGLIGLVVRTFRYESRGGAHLLAAIVCTGRPTRLFCSAVTPATQTILATRPFSEEQMLSGKERLSSTLHPSFLPHAATIRGAYGVTAREISATRPAFVSADQTIKVRNSSSPKSQ